MAKLVHASNFVVLVDICTKSKAIHKRRPTKGSLSNADKGEKGFIEMRMSALFVAKLRFF